MKNVRYLAVDLGPKLALRSLADQLPGRWLAQDAGTLTDWKALLDAQSTELLICGTSDTDVGIASEAAARIAANALGVRCVVIEDFPGNYAEVSQGRPDALFVDSEFAARLARAKSGPDLAAHVCPASRYDPLRRCLGRLRSTSRHLGDHAVLWIGQPETEDSLTSLECLLPALEAASAPLWFRAHPRDKGYARGAYAKLLDRAQARDLTAVSLDECLRMGPALVATQFSSVAIEAGFWGIPALNVLLPDAGAARLAAKKGYAVPPWCEEGAAFLIRDRTEAHGMLSMALASPQARARAQECFDRYFSVHEEASRQLINVLYNHGFL